MADLKLVTDENKASDPLDDRTCIYPLVDVKICPSKFETVADLRTGGKRKRKHALVLGMTAIPDFAHQPEPLLLPGDLQTLILDADNLDDLRARAYKEVDGMIDQLKEALQMIKEGKDPSKVN